MQTEVLLLVVFFLCSSINTAIAKDVGKQAATFEIKEEGFVSMM